MDNRINTSNPSFRANIVTRIQDRNGVMEKVTKRFAEKTKNYTGNLYILESQNNSKQKGLMFCINDKSVLFSNKTDDLLATYLRDASEVTDKVVEDITNRYANILRALKLDTKFYTTMKNYFNNIAELRATKQQYLEKLSNSTENGNYTLTEMYKQLITESDKMAQVISEKIGNTAQRYYNLLNSIKENEPTIKDWCNATQETLRAPRF